MVPINIAITEIYLLNSFLDNTYEHQLTFSNANTQETYFKSLVKHNRGDMSFQRNQWSIRWPDNIENLYDCNYVMFKNTTYGGKWFFGFITEFQYIAANTTDISIEIDVYQTYMFDMNILSSYVIREHVTNDSIGVNTVPERIETGPYTVTNTSNFTVDDFYVIILATELVGDDTGWAPPQKIGGFPIATYSRILSRLSDFDAASMQAILDEYADAGKIEAIIAIFTSPFGLTALGDSIFSQTFTGASRTLNYTPRNNKLYTYPYVLFEFSSLSQVHEMRYELFSGTPSFTIQSGFGVNLQAVAYPNNYENRPKNIDYMCSVSDWPLVPWISDYFQNWVASNKGRLTASAVNHAANLVNDIVTGQFLGTLGSIANTIGAVYDQNTIPNSMSGPASAGDINAIAGNAGFYTTCKAITPEYARIIDEFFTCYGYKVNRLKSPNITGRTNWNYVKTAWINITGNIPNNYQSKLQQIFNNGITFWHNPSTFGDYSQAN